MANQYTGLTKEQRHELYEQEERERLEAKVRFRKQSIVDHYLYSHKFRKEDHAECLAKELGLPLETAQRWLSGEHDFTLSEITRLEEVCHNDNAIAVAMHGTYGYCANYPNQAYEEVVPWKLYDQNHVSQPLLNMWAGDHETWCVACNWSGTYEDFHRLNEESAFKRPFTRPQQQECCPNCHREFTLVDIE
jgi:hypothetical protein